LIKSLPILLLAAASLPAAEKEPGSSGVSSLLPDGSQLEGVILPRYDEERNLVAALRADTMELVDDRTIAGHTVLIDWFGPDQRPRGRFRAAELSLTDFNGTEESGLLKAREVDIGAEGFHIKGRSLTAPLGKEADFEGFLAGPATTRASLANQTTAGTGQTGGTSAAANTAAAANQAPEAAAAEPADASAPKADLSAALEASDAANRAARQFLEESGLGSLTAGTTTFAAPTQPHPFQKQDGDMVVSCDGGMYFNRKEGVLVYLGNVRVNHPDFTMTGANELKIFVKEIPKESKNPMNADAKAKAETKIEVQRITASGAVLVEQQAGSKPSDKDPIRASGALLVYDRNNDLLTISGGYPWVVQGGLALRAKQPNLTLRIHPEQRRVETQGAWDTIVPVKELGGDNR
jgi:hypothetical protein